MDIEVVYGSTGTGKSRYCYENYPDAYWKSKNSGQQQFWDGYNGEETIVIDEFYGWFFLGTTSFDSQTDIPFPSILSMERYHLLLGRLSSLVINTQRLVPNSKYGWDDSNPLRGELKLYGNLALLKYPTTGSPLLQPLQL